MTQHRMKSFDHGTKSIDVKHLTGDVYEGYPIELHHKEDGTITDEPSFAIVIRMSNGDNIVGQFSLETLTDCLNNMGYDIFSPKIIKHEQTN